VDLYWGNCGARTRWRSAAASPTVSDGSELRPPGSNTNGCVCIALGESEVTVGNELVDNFQLLLPLHDSCTLRY
jgi:hypothetical protein